jgi:hypothetical protein
MNRYYFLIFLLILFSCGNKKVKQNAFKGRLCRVSTYHYYNSMLNRVHALTIDKKITKDCIIFRYEPFPDMAKIKSSLQIKIFRGQDSFVLVDGDTCIFEESKDFFVKSKKFNVKKFFFDNKDAVDEECEYLINDSLGLVYVNSVVWPAFSTYISSWPSYELSLLFDKDTTLFIRHKNNMDRYELRLQELLKL